MFYKFLSQELGYLFQSINHGITGVFLDQVRSVTAQFFALPMEEKLKCSRAVDSTEGYGNDMILSEDQILDWTDRLYLIVSPEDRRQFKFWPEKPEIFRYVLTMLPEDYKDNG